MNVLKNAKMALILGLTFVMLFAHLPVIYTMYYHNLSNAPSAEKGGIDLSSLSPARTIVLDGYWEFYWDRLIVTEPAQEDEPDLLIKVPDYWSKYKIDGIWLPAGGIGSYRLLVRGLDYSRPVMVCIPNFGGAYRITVDGSLTAESGIISKNLNEIFTIPRASIYPVTLTADAMHEVVIEAASLRFSGLYMAPVLKDYEAYRQEDSIRSSMRLILFGMVLFSFFALLVIYMLSLKRGYRSLWLPAMILCMLMRLMLTTEFFGFWQKTFFLNLSYEATNELMFLMTFVLKFMLIFLLQEEFGVTFSRKEKAGFLIYYTVIYLIYLFVPHGIYNRYLTIILPVSTFTLEFYSFFKVYFGRQQLKKCGLIVYWGIIIAISGLIIDSYYINGNIYPNMSLVLLVSLTVFIIILSLVYALRTADVYSDFVLSSSRLEQAKRQIDMQMEYYDTLNRQINEIRGIKHDIRHFIGAIRRLSDEGRYEELRRFLSEYGEKTETYPLPVYCENVVANSILGYYSLRAKERDIPFKCVCDIQKQLCISDSELCVVLGNALENAIEACENMENANARFISAEAKAINGQLLIRIENSYNGCLNIQDGIYISTKSGSFHGIGLQNIKKVVDDYKGYVKTEYDGKIFVLMAAFPNLCIDDDSITATGKLST